MHEFDMIRIHDQAVYVTLAAMNAQQYEELLVAMACVAYGILLIWAPDAVRWLPSPRRKRAFAIGVIVVGAIVAVASVFGQ